MTGSSIHPAGEKMQKAIIEFSEKLEDTPTADRKKILAQISMQFDLSPIECDFLLRHCTEEKNQQG